MKHTELPWQSGKANLSLKIEDMSTLDLGGVIWVEDVGTVAWTDETFGVKTAVANAEFIVKACNAYPKLVEALKYCSNFILEQNEFSYPKENAQEANDLLKELGEIK